MQKLQPCLLYRKTAGFLAVDSKGKQRTLGDGSKIAGALIFFRIMLVDQFQGFPELKHSCELMLAGIAAEAVADQIADFTIPVFKLHGVGFAALHDGIAVATV